MAQAGTAGLYGTFAITAGGAWTYTASSAHNEFQAGTTYTDTFSVASSDGTLTSVTINIAGSNDAATLSADVRNLTETNSAADISSSGTLTITDPDSLTTFVAQAGTVGLYGTFAIDSAGAWTYTASSAHDAFMAGATYTDTFEVASTDGTLTSVTINIAGTADATNSVPTLTGLATPVTFLENTANAAPQIIDADVTFTDPDNNFDTGALTVTGLLAAGHGGDPQPGHRRGPDRRLGQRRHLRRHRDRQLRGRRRQHAHRHLQRGGHGGGDRGADREPDLRQFLGRADREPQPRAQGH